MLTLKTCQRLVLGTVKGSMGFYTPTGLRLKPGDKARPEVFPDYDPWGSFESLYDVYDMTEKERERNSEHARYYSILARRICKEICCSCTRGLTPYYMSNEYGWEPDVEKSKRRGRQ